MKRLVVVALLCAGCAMFKAHDPFRNPDGTLNVRKIVLYISYGIEADCALGESTLSMEICTQGRNAIALTNEISTNDPVLLKKSIVTILETAAHDHPQLAPYFEWGVRLLVA